MPTETDSKTDGITRTSRFKVPGEGSSVAISIATIVLLFLAWYLVTRLGLIKPLFLPSPHAVWHKSGFQAVFGTSQHTPSMPPVP